MRIIKLLVVGNLVEHWRTWPDKIDELQKWFSPKVYLAVAIVHTKYENIPFIQYENPVPDQASYKNRLGVDYGWYDRYVSALAGNFDIVLFVINASQWPVKGDMRGWRTDRTNGAVELQIGAGENETISWSDGYRGGMFFNLARHEIMHAFFMITGQNDTTHFWWNQSPEKLINALNELQFIDPRVAEEITRLERIIEFLRKILGLQVQLEKLKMEEEKPQVLPKNPTKKDFCLTIQEYEGYFAPREYPDFPNGSMAWRNKNPLNLKYANQIGSIGSNKGFAIFPDYTTGFAAGMRQIELAWSGKSRVYKPTDTLYDFFKKFAPSTDDNNPVKYAEFVAKKLNISPNAQISSLT